MSSYFIANQAALPVEGYAPLIPHKEQESTSFSNIRVGVSLTKGIDSFMLDDLCRRVRWVSHTFGTAFQVRRKEMGGNTDATSRPMTKNSQLMSMPI